MAKRLWNYFDGEPFLTNPHLAIFTPNPRKRKVRKTMALRRRRVARRRTAPKLRNVRRAPRRRRALRNPYPVAGMVINPRHRRRHRRNPVLKNAHRRKHHYRRNPAIMGLSLPPMKAVLFTGIGYIGTQSLPALLTPMLPASMVPSTPMGRYAMYGASGFLLTMGVKMLSNSNDAMYTAIGSLVFIAKQAIMDFMPGVIPGLSGYTAPTMGGYVMGNQPTMKSLSGMRGLGMPMTSFPGSVGASNPIPARFNRF